MTDSKPDTGNPDNDNRPTWADRGMEAAINTGLVAVAAFVVAAFLTFTVQADGAVSLYWLLVVGVLMGTGVYRVLYSVVDWFWPFDDGDDA